MKALLKLILLFVLISCCKSKDPKPQEPLKSYDNALAATWKLDSVTSNSGMVTTNPSDKEIFTIFQTDTNKLSFENGGSSGVGNYKLSTEKGINIIIQRGDFGGWPNGPWLDSYLANINKASSYTVSASKLRIVTSELNTLFFTKQ